jgi:hypothetical protein
MSEQLSAVARSYALHKVVRGSASSLEFLGYRVPHDDFQKISHDVRNKE